MITFGFITRNSLRANKLGQSFGAKMTETSMPQGSRCSGGCQGGYAAGGWWEEWVKVTRAIAPGDHAPCL
jgi:hypothetical protein